MLPWHHCITQPLQPKVCIHLRVETGQGGGAAARQEYATNASLNKLLQCTRGSLTAMYNTQDPLHPGQVKLIWQQWSRHSNWLSRTVWLTAALCIFPRALTLERHASAGWARGARHFTTKTICLRFGKERERVRKCVVLAVCVRFWLFITFTKTAAHICSHRGSHEKATNFRGGLPPDCSWQQKTCLTKGL